MGALLLTRSPQIVNRGQVDFWGTSEGPFFMSVRGEAEVVFPIPAIPKPVFRYSGLFNTGKYRQNFSLVSQ
jgi:hypothetical protein